MENDQLNELNEKNNIPTFGYNLLRLDLLPELLGKEHDKIIYWAGKSLARKYPLQAIDDIIDFFEKAGWGSLTLLKEKNTERIFELTSELHSKKGPNYSRQLEAGFLAEQIEQQTNFISETTTAKKGVNVTFIVRSDKKDQVNND